MNWAAITAMITALTAVGALVFTGLSLNATRDQVTIAQAQNKVAEQGQLTDRYTKAVEQLDKAGDDHLQARLGAIYALEHLAQDSTRDQPTIIEVLSAFVRTTTPKLESLQENRCPDQAPGVDIKAALVVLGRRDVAHDHNSYINLVTTCLRWVRLDGLNFRGADLTNADLLYVDLIDMDFTDAYIG